MWGGGDSWKRARVVQYCRLWRVSRCIGGDGHGKDHVALTRAEEDITPGDALGHNRSLLLVTTGDSNGCGIRVLLVWVQRHLHNSQVDWSQRMVSLLPA